MRVAYRLHICLLACIGRCSAFCKKRSPRHHTKQNNPTRRGLFDPQVLVGDEPRGGLRDRAGCGHRFHFRPLPDLQPHGGNGSAALGAEIVAFDSLKNCLWVIGPNGADILDPASRSLTSTLDLSAFGETNSIAVNNGMAAFAIANSVRTDPGAVHFYNTSTFDFINAVTVGALPDMVTFTPDGSRVLVANEGEPNSYRQPDSVDPVGSVSVIDTATLSVPLPAALPLLGSALFGLTVVARRRRSRAMRQAVVVDRRT